MMKRIISLVLASIFLFTSFSLVGAAQNSDSYYNPEDAELLFALGVTDSTVLSGAPVTRAQFTRYAMKLAGIPITPYKGTEFADVPQAHIDYSYIMSAVDFGLISIADNFRPEDTIAPNEAFKIIVKLLGYDFMAEAKGGYPSGYLQTAQTIDLLDGVNTSASAMADYDVCTLLCNALKVNLPDVSYNGDGNDYYIGTATILSQYRGIVEVRGVVDGVSHYSEYNASGLGDDRVSINGTEYNTGAINCDLLFGYDVVAYLDTKSNTLISCTASDSNRVLSVYAEDIESFKNSTFVYADKDSKSRSVSISIDTTIFYNGRIFDYDSLKMIPESGSLTFISPNGSGAFSTLYIKSYKTIVVSRTSMSDEYFIIDKYSSSDGSLIIDPDETELVITDQDGNELSFASILAGDVVNAAISDDGKLVELICVKDEFLGTYSGYSDDYIEVDGSAYRLSSALEGKVSDIISLGKQAIFRLDIDHRIADIIPSAGVGEEIGYLVVGRLFESGLTTRLAVRILNLDGKIYDYDFADTFSVNGRTYKDFKLAYDTYKSSDYESLPCSVVKYAVNTDGKIKSLIYPDNMGGSGGLYHTNSLTSNSQGYKFSRWYKNIGNSIICDTDMVLFKVPNPLYSVDSIDDELYTIENWNLIGDDGSTKGYTLAGYTTNPDDGMSKYILMQKIEDDASSDVTVTGAPYMVSSVRKVLVDGDPREAMVLCNTNYGVSAPRVVYSKGENDFSASGVQGGDIVRININERNIVRGFTIVWKKGDSLLSNGKTELSSGTWKNAQYRIKMAYAYSVRTDVLDAVSVDVAPESVTDDSKMPLYMPLAKVFKYDERLQSVVELTIDEIKDYKNFGDKMTKFIYNTQYESFENVFIIE